MLVSSNQGTCSRILKENFGLELCSKKGSIDFGKFDFLHVSKILGLLTAGLFCDVTGRKFSSILFFVITIGASIWLFLSKSVLSVFVTNLVRNFFLTGTILILVILITERWIN